MRLQVLLATHTAGSPTSSGMVGGAASSSGPAEAAGTGSNPAEKYLPNLPELEEHHVCWKEPATEDNAGEQAMSFRDHRLFAAKSGDPGSSSTEPAPTCRLTMSSEQMEKLRASNPLISHYAWLVDSGATCHVLSDQALSLCQA